MQWIDFALLSNEKSLVDSIKALQVPERKQLYLELLDLLELNAIELENSILRILIERSRGYAMPSALWSRPHYASSSIRDAGTRHLKDLGLEASESRLHDIQRLYQDFVEERARASVTEEALTLCGFKCSHCGLKFYNEDLESKGFESTHGNRPRIKVDAFKEHWSTDSYRIPTMDHDWPVATYGSNAVSNLKVLCRGCNEGKANYLALEQMGAWTGLQDRRQLVANKVPLWVFYAQLRRHPICSISGTTWEQSELTVRLRNPGLPAILDNLVTVASPDLLVT